MPGRRLSEREIADVRARRAEGIGEGVIAESFGISRATVSRYTAGDSRIVHRPRQTTSELLFARAPAPEPVDPPEARPDDRRARNEAIRAANDSPVVLAERFGLSTAQIGRIRSGVPRPLTRRQEAEQVRAGAWRAECMDDEEWTEWVDMNPISSVKDHEIASRPCTDCPLGFAAEMRAEGRCNGSPGWQPPVDEEEEATMGEQITVTNVRIEAPCGSCLHRDVCAIRASLGGLEAADVTLPKPDPALTVVTTLQVECSHYRREGKGPGTGRRLNLSDEERERRREQGRTNLGTRREAVPA